MLNVHDRHYYLFNDADFQIKGSLKTPPVTHATSSTLTQEVKKSGVSEWTTYLLSPILVGVTLKHGLRTPNEGTNQRNLKFWADMADKICFGRT